METVDQPLQAMLSLKLRCDLSRSTLFKARTIFRHIRFCQKRTRTMTMTMTNVRDIGKHDFLSALLHPILLNDKRPAEEKRMRGHFVTHTKHCIH